MTANRGCSARQKCSSHVIRAVFGCSIIVAMLFGQAPGPVIAQERYYDPRATAEILLSATFTKDELLFAQRPTLEPDPKDGAIYQVQVFGASGMIVYDIFPTPEALQETSYLSLGLPFESEEFLGRKANVYHQGDGYYVSCTIDLNVLICGFSGPDFSPYPDGAAILLASGGLAHLLRVAESQVMATAPSQSAASAPPTQPPAVAPRSTQHPATVPRPTHVPRSTDVPAHETVSLSDLLPLTNASCFRAIESETYPFQDVVDFLWQAGADEADIRAWAWQKGAYLVLRCATPPPGGASQIDIVVHHFGDSRSAQAAVPYFVTGYQTTSNEARLCGSENAVLVCITGRSTDRSPTAEVDAVLEQVLNLVE